MCTLSELSYFCSLFETLQRIKSLVELSSEELTFGLPNLQLLLCWPIKRECQRGIAMLTGLYVLPKLEICRREI